MQLGDRNVVTVNARDTVCVKHGSDNVLRHKEECALRNRLVMDLFPKERQAPHKVLLSARAG